MAQPKRILILGSTGMLGHKLLERLSARFPEVWGSVRGSRAEFEKHPFYQRFIEKGVLAFGLDVTDRASLNSALDRIAPDVIINCVAVTKRHEGHAADPAETAKIIQINAELPYLCAAWAKPQNARVIHFSTDCVFDGAQGGYTESSFPNASDLYGRSKFLGEIGEKQGRCLTIRSSFVGKELFHHTELVEWFLKQGGKKIEGYRNAVFSGLATWTLADLLTAVIENRPELAGVFQVASEPISKYDLLGLMKEAFDLNVTIEPFDEFTCKRNLDGSRFRQLTGYVAPTWKEMVRGIADGR